MKKSNFLFIISTVLCLIISSQVSAQKEALDYLNKINTELDAIMNDTWDYVSAASHGKNARKVENRRKDLLKTTLQAKSRVEKMTTYNESSVLRDSVVSYLQLSYDVLNKDFEKIVDMEEVAEQSYDLMEAYLLAKELADKKLDDAGSMIEAQHRVFAANNNITLIDNPDEISKKLKIASEVHKYYNEIFLIYFKSFKQEAYVIEALNKGDINAMEQNKNALITTSNEGLELIKNIKSYKGDNSVVTACKQLLTFYQNEATKNLPILIDFYMKKEKLDKIKAAFDALSQSQKTKEEVDKYNNASKEFNDSVNSFNTLNAELNNDRTKFNNQWNDNVAKFLDKHTPKYKK